MPDTTVNHLDVEIPTRRLHRRAESSYRLEALDGCEHSDPLRCLADDVPTIVTARRFGLTEAELRKHANSLIAAGWSIDEVVATLGVRPKAA